MISRLSKKHATTEIGKPDFFLWPNHSYVGFSGEGNQRLCFYYPTGGKPEYSLLLYPDKIKPLAVGTILTITQE